MGTTSADTSRVKVKLVTLSESSGDYTTTTTTAMIIGSFSNRTGTSVDNGARKSNSWLDQWKSGKSGTGSRV